VKDHPGRYSRGYLPHIEAGAVPQFLTWRLNDSLPTSVIEAWREELSTLPEDERKREIQRRVESYCDAGHGSCLLAQPGLARVVQETLFYDHGRRYSLHAWVVMPNHVHVLLTPIEGATLAEIMRVLKSVSSTRINKKTGQEGRMWQPDFYDRMIRTTDHLDGVRQYIEWNPVKAKLCTDPAAWPYSSANPNAAG
jgi:REP element-mobilizing transposase RayT